MRSSTHTIRYNWSVYEKITICKVGAAVQPAETAGHSNSFVKPGTFWKALFKRFRKSTRRERRLGKDQKSDIFANRQIPSNRNNQVMENFSIQKNVVPVSLREKFLGERHSVRHEFTNSLEKISDIKPEVMKSQEDEVLSSVTARHHSDASGTEYILRHNSEGEVTNRFLSSGQGVINPQLDTETPFKTDSLGFENSWFSRFLSLGTVAKQRRSWAIAVRLEEEKRRPLYQTKVEEKKSISGDTLNLWHRVFGKFPKPKTLYLEKIARRYEDQCRRLDKTKSKEKQTEIFERVQKIADEYFVFFQKILGITNCSSHYDKSKFDESMEKCFGSMDQKGSMIFNYDNVSFKVDNEVSAHKVFSLYLCRKVLCPAHPKKKEQSLESFYSRVCSELPKRNNKELKDMKELFERIVDSIFTKKNLQDWKEKRGDHYVPMHDAACVERKKKKGGKRHHQYIVGDNYEKNKVEPVAIYTGGKIRVITKDSAYNMKYAYLNQYMASMIRRYDWCIFGRTVEEWLNSNPDFITGDEDFLSGDLESATDLFDGWFADQVIDHLVSLDDDLTTDDSIQMKSFTTRAKFSSKTQTRGQLMGSVLSFPILCLVSLCAAIHRIEGDEILSLKKNYKKKDVRIILENIKKVGINGDDVIRRTNDGGKQWEKNVELVAGRVSRGKSLLNPTHFTVNSELWIKKTEETVSENVTIRPSLVLSLSDGRKTNPCYLYLNYAASPLLNDTFKKDLNLEKRLKVSIPTKWGGLGLFKAFDYNECIKAKISSEKRKKREWIRPAKYWKDKEIPIFDTYIKILESDWDKVQKEVFEFSRGLPQWKESGEEKWEDTTEEVEESIKYSTQADKDLLKSHYDQYMDINLRQEKVILVPSSFAHLGEIFELKKKSGRS